MIERKACAFAVRQVETNPRKAVLMSQDLAKLADKTLHDPKALLEDVLDHLKTASEAAGDKAHEALEEAMHAITRGATALGEEASDRTKKLAKKARKEIKAHPATAALTASAVAAAALAVAGLMVARRLHDHEND